MLKLTNFFHVFLQKRSTFLFERMIELSHKNFSNLVSSQVTKITRTDTEKTAEGQLYGPLRINRKPKCCGHRTFYWDQRQSNFVLGSAAPSDVVPTGEGSFGARPSTDQVCRVLWGPP